MAAAYYLAGQGIHIMGIIDRTGGPLKADGFGLEEIRGLQGQHTSWQKLTVVRRNQHNHLVDIFIPAAASHLVAREQLEQLLASGLKVISCGANVPFANPEIFFDPTGEFADQHAAVIPDFIANYGMTRVFAYLMETDAEITDQANFADTSRIIGAALERTHQENTLATGIAQRSFEMALRQLV